ncbi:hypothetical protein [Xenorhabdus bovienii]|uniref:hypothetical protein n=1 Tax=Xenorhabdus bovienii TaxID=40576 RepID=UPI00237C6AE1|nr:hypothetical protein [Xenorhabdus bovienii]MDE1483944.1 hypothetical protein [Xenorhabdus bovienii]MDE9443447.1 hypothetical protein [Xenorhabdus bovienii]MDE9536142.1 hypothetical protein [Xenorhabdus bovienii]
MTNTKNECRIAFELFMGNAFSYPTSPLDKHDDGTYSDIAAQNYWEAFQAGWETSRNITKGSTPQFTAEIVLHHVFSIDGDARAIGYIFNDSKQRFKEGEKIRTSQVLNLDTFEIDGYITTQNSIYKIREPIK